MFDLLSELRPQRNLSEELVLRLRTEITSGRLAPGERLPTERKLMESLAVSRTVVREAISALRAEGLVVTRQGSGAFVADAIRHTFRIDPGGVRSIEDVLHIIEVRRTIEMGAVVLAARRRSATDLKRIDRTLKAFERCIESGGLAIKEDLDFHCAIAQASGNPLFAQLIRTIGQVAIPRTTVRDDTIDEAAARREYLKIVNQEHISVYEAVRDGDPDRAWEQMSSIFMKSIKRYEGFRDEDLTADGSSS